MGAAGTGAAQPGDDRGRGQRVHPGHPARAGESGSHAGHRIPGSSGRERLSPAGRRHVPRRYRGGPAGGLPRRRDPGRGRPPAEVRGISPCFRREAGSTAAIPVASSGCTSSTRSRCSPSVGPTKQRRNTSDCWAGEREFLDLLELPYRVIDVATGDLGASAARKFDIEAWIPTQGRYREVTSASNCGTFQARRLNIRYRDADGAISTAATLNGTLVAMPGRSSPCLRTTRTHRAPSRSPARCGPTWAVVRSCCRDREQRIRA